MKSNEEILKEVHNILADFYDEELERNENNAKRNVSRTIRILKERIEEIEIKHKITEKEKEQAIKRIEKNMPDNWRLNIG
jgi:hypothetical protein